MKWTRLLPRAAGYYWLRDAEGDPTPGVCHVKEGENGFTVQFIGSLYRDPVKVHEGAEWYGPLTVPEG